MKKPSKRSTSQRNRKPNKKTTVVCVDCDKSYTLSVAKPCDDGKFRCKSCRMRRQNKKQKNNIVAWQKSPRGKQKSRERLLKSYGLSSKAYNDLLKKQGGVCAICKVATTNDCGRNLVVDHDHKTGRVRGLLCDKCNRALGGLSDDTSTVYRAMTYLNSGCCDSKWDARLLAFGDLIASLSNDLSTKVGAIIVDSDHVIRATGYNGFPRNVDYTNARLERPQKYWMMVHAEANALVHAGRDVAKGCTLYLSTLPKERSSLPCNECAKLIIQAGIREVVCRRIEYELQDGDPKDTWRDILRYSLEMFNEAGVIVREVGL